MSVELYDTDRLVEVDDAPEDGVGHRVPASECERHGRGRGEAAERLGDCVECLAERAAGHVEVAVVRDPAQFVGNDARARIVDADGVARIANGLRPLSGA
jgi:hypothetical protein